MSIAEKMLIMAENEQTITENTQKVYDAGYEKGKAESENTEWVEDNSEIVYERPCYGKGQGVSLYVTENGTGIYKDNGRWESGYFEPQWSYNIFNNIPQVHGENVSKVIEDERVTILGKGLFGCMKNLEVVKLPQNILSIGSSCFSYCESLKKVEMPESVNSMESNVFQYCYHLESFKIPNLVTSLGSYTFSNCLSLKIVEGIERLESIGANSFDCCVELSGSITFNAKLQSLTSNAFRNCFNVTEFVFLGVPEKVEQTVFSGCVGVTNFSIPQGWNIDLYLNSMLKLTPECVQNIGENLADLTGQTAKTVKFHSTTIKNFTEEQILTFINKNWIYE